MRVHNAMELRAVCKGGKSKGKCGMAKSKGTQGGFERGSNSGWDQGCVRGSQASGTCDKGGKGQKSGKGTGKGYSQDHYKDPERLHFVRGSPDHLAKVSQQRRVHQIRTGEAAFSSSGASSAASRLRLIRCGRALWARFGSWRSIYAVLGKLA